MAILALCFENQNAFVSYYSEGDIKLFVHINICIQKLWLVLLSRRYVFLFINIGTIIFVIVILTKIKFIVILFLCIVAKFPKDIVPIVPISVITSISLKLHQLSTITDQLRIGSQSRKCSKMIERKQRVKQLRRFDIETSRKTHVKNSSIFRQF